MLEIIKQIICCPFCGSDLKIGINISCEKCLWEENNIKHNVNLKLKKPKIISIDQELGSNINSFNRASDRGVYNFKFGFDSNPNGMIIDDKKKKKAQGKLLSWIPRKEGIALDIGSANDENLKNYTKMAGLQLVRCDYDNPNADLLVDAHSLPFKDNSIDVLINLAVMEHMEFPYIAGREFYRVLKPGGVLLTNVAFLQQHHMSSWYHFTHYGVYSWLTNSGFDEKRFMIDAAGKKYHGIFTTSSLVGIPKFVKSMILNPVFYLHRLLWKIGEVKSGENREKQRHLQTTAAINSVAFK